MPIFTYHCDDCDENTELLMKIQDADKTYFCETCGSQLEKVVDIPSRFVRGSGSWSSPA